MLFWIESESMKKEKRKKSGSMAFNYKLSHIYIENIYVPSQSLEKFVLPIGIVK